MIPTHWTPLKVFLSVGAVLGVCTAIATAWVQMGGAVPASQQLLYETASGLSDKIHKVEADGKQQTLESAKWGRKIYTKEVHDLLVIPEPQGAEQKQFWREQIDDARRNQKRYEAIEEDLLKK